MASHHQLTSRLWQQNGVVRGSGPEPQPKDEAAFYRYVVGHPQVSVALCGLRDTARFARIADGARGQPVPLGV